MNNKNKAITLLAIGLLALAAIPVTEATPIHSGLTMNSPPPDCFIWYDNLVDQVVCIVIMILGH